MCSIDISALILQSNLVKKFCATRWHAVQDEQVQWKLSLGMSQFSSIFLIRSCTIYERMRRTHLWMMQTCSSVHCSLGLRTPRVKHEGEYRDRASVSSESWISILKKTTLKWQKVQQLGLQRRRFDGWRIYFAVFGNAVWLQTEDRFGLLYSCVWEALPISHSSPLANSWNDTSSLVLYGQNVSEFWFIHL